MEKFLHDSSRFFLSFPREFWINFYKFYVKMNEIYTWVEERKKRFVDFSKLWWKEWRWMLTTEPFIEKSLYFMVFWIQFIMNTLPNMHFFNVVQLVGYRMKGWILISFGKYLVRLMVGLLFCFICIKPSRLYSGNHNNVENNFYGYSVDSLIRN